MDSKPGLDTARNFMAETSCDQPKRQTSLNQNQGLTFSKLSLLFQLKVTLDGNMLSVIGAIL